MKVDHHFGESNLKERAIDRKLILTRETRRVSKHWVSQHMCRGNFKCHMKRTNKNHKKNKLL